MYSKGIDISNRVHKAIDSSATLSMTTKFAICMYSIPYLRDV